MAPHIDPCEEPLDSLPPYNMPGRMSFPPYNMTGRIVTMAEPEPSMLKLLINNKYFPSTASSRITLTTSTPYKEINKSVTTSISPIKISKDG